MNRSGPQRFEKQRNKGAQIWRFERRTRKGWRVFRALKGNLQLIKLIIKDSPYEMD